MDSPPTKRVASAHVPLQRVLALRDGKRLVRNLVYSKASGKRPHVLRVVRRFSTATDFTLQNKDFYAQYKRAVDAIAETLGIDLDAPLRAEMLATADDFLKYYELQIHTVEVGEGPHKLTIENVIVVTDAEGIKQVATSGAGHPELLVADGRVRGVTFKARRGMIPAHIHVRPGRGKSTSFNLENTSFSSQYAAAIAYMVNAFGLSPSDPVREKMEMSGEAFLRHYGLTTQPISIADAVVEARSNT